MTLNEFNRLKYYADQLGYKDKVFFNLFKGEHEYNFEEDTLDWFVEKLLNGKVD